MSYLLFMVEGVGILYGAGCGESEALRARLWGEVWDAPWGKWFIGCEARGEWGEWGEWGCKGDGWWVGCERCWRLGGLISTSVNSSLKSSRTRLSRLISVKPKARNSLITAYELNKNSSLKPNNEKLCRALQNVKPNTTKTKTLDEQNCK